jgi:copper chaperone CopZ
LGLLGLTTGALAQVKSILVAAGGVWCTSCTYRLEKAIQRLEGVEKVRAEIEPPRAEVTPRAGAWVEAGRLRSAVKSAGFKPGGVRYTVEGSLVEWQGQPALRLPRSERVLVLQADPKAPELYERLRRMLPATDKMVAVEGEFVDHAVADDKTSPAALRLCRLETGR